MKVPAHLGAAGCSGGFVPKHTGPGHCRPGCCKELFKEVRLGGSGGAAAEEELSGCSRELFKEVGLVGSGGTDCPDRP